VENKELICDIYTGKADRMKVAPKTMDPDNK